MKIYISLPLVAFSIWKSGIVFTPKKSGNVLRMVSFFFFLAKELLVKVFFL